MANSNLPRVDDLEKSAQWASLTDEINDLEKLCRLNNHRHSRRQPLLRCNNYHRYSVPQMQKATSVWIESGDELNDEHLQTSNDFTKSNTAETSYRWSWRPKTEFERSYFLDDYDQRRGSFQCHPRPQKRYSPHRCNDEPSDDNVNDEACNDYEVARRDSSDRSREDPFDEDKCSVNYGRMYENDPPAYSGTRERLHEIFERNRYLRRKFFASMPGDDTSQRYDFPKVYESKNPATKYSGFGSTETITSQSNQSSISSNDRKSRCQSNVTPELVEQETCNSLTNVNHVQGGRILSTTRNGKLLVNVATYETKKPTDTVSVENSSQTPGEEFNSSSNSKHDFDDVEQSGRYEPNAWICLEREDENECQSGERGINGNDEKVDRFSNSRNNESDYVATGVSQVQWQEYTDKPANDDCTNDFPNLWVENGESRYSRGFQNLKDRGTSADNSRSHLRETTRDNCGSNENIAVSNSYGKSKNSTNEWDSLESVCKSLPNLSFYEKTFDSSSSASPSTNNSSRKYCSKSATTNIRSIRDGETNEGKPIRRRFVSQIDLSNIRAEPTSFTLRRVKVTKVPPPLDLSRVNETYEEVEALERKRLMNTRLVNVSLVRNYDRRLEGQAAIIRDDNREDRVGGQKKTDGSSRGNDERTETMVSEVGYYLRRVNANDQCQQTKEDELSRARFERGLHKSCGDLTATVDLRSPQLVNNYNSSTIDVRANDGGCCTLNHEQSSQVARLQAFRQRRGVVPLSDHVNSISSGPQSGSGNTLPSVYGPIPYSQ